MNVLALKVEERVEKPQALRRNGFIPGAIFGEGIKEGISVKMDRNELTKLLKNHVENARLQVELGDTSRLCLVKEVQRNVISGDILHVDFQSVSENEMIRMKIPIHYTGVAHLEANRLLLLTSITEIEVEGKLSVLPETVNIDVSGKHAGDKILAKELKLDASIRLHIDRDSILAVVSNPRENVSDAAAVVDATNTAVH